jgi:hypothetical protein
MKTQMRISLQTGSNMLISKEKAQNIDYDKSG